MTIAWPKRPDLPGKWLERRGRGGFRGHQIYATSSFEYFARRVFWPTELNRTTSLVSSSSGSTLTTVPRPNCACCTRRPGLSPAGVDAHLSRTATSTPTLTPAATPAPTTVSADSERRATMAAVA
jgi:hypothetical protein